MRQPDAAIISTMGESYTDKVYRLQRQPRVSRTARFLAELKGIEAGAISSVRMPIEGTVELVAVEMTPDKAGELLPGVEAHLTALCENDQHASSFIGNQACRTLIAELDADNNAG